MNFDDLPETPRVERMTLKPGDKVVITFQRSQSAEAFDHLAEKVKSWGLPPGSVIILDSGASLQVLENVP